MMALFVERKLRKLLDRRNHRAELLRAITGDGNGVVKVPGHDDWYYVRPEEDDLPLVVGAGDAPKVQGYSVWVGPDECYKRRRKILGRRRISGESAPSGLESHSDSHGPEGADVVYIMDWQIIPLTVYAYDGMTVRVNQGYVNFQGQLTFVSQQDIDMTGSIPGSGARYSLIRLDSSGVADVQDGSAVASYADLTDSDIPVCENGYATLAFVRLYYGQTELSTNVDDLDVRTVVWGSGLFDLSGFAGFDDSEGDPVDVDATAAADGTSEYAARRDHRHHLGDHEHVEADITDLDHDAVKLQGRNLSSSVPNDEDVIAWDNANGVWKPVASPGGGPSAHVTPFTCNGRMTLTSGTPVTTSDVSDAGTLYFCPFRGNRIALYDGAAWQEISFVEKSISLSGLTVSKNYDLFGYLDTGDLALELLVWTNDTTRATGLSTQDGIYIENGDETRRYLGTIRIESDGNCDDSAAMRHVWNYYNQIEKNLVARESTEHTYNGSFRKWNNSDTNNLLKFVIGIIEQPITTILNVSLKTANSANYAAVVPYVNGAIWPNGDDCDYLGATYIPNKIYLGKTYNKYPSLGYSYIQTYEGSNATGTFTSMSLVVSLLA
jgi:hypothetical protein